MSDRYSVECFSKAEEGFTTEDTESTETEESLDDMGWATGYIKQLSEGKTVQFRPRGNSMSGRIENGQLVTVEPLGDRECEVGNIVLCK